MDQVLAPVQSAASKEDMTQNMVTKATRDTNRVVSLGKDADKASLFWI